MLSNDELGPSLKRRQISCIWNPSTIHDCPLVHICTTIGKYFLWSWIVPRLIKRLRQYMSSFSLGWFQDGGSESLLMTFREKEAKIWLGITLHWNYSANILVDRSQVIGFDLFIQSYIFLGPQRHLSRYKHCWKIDVVHMVTKFLNNIFPNFKVHVSQFLYVHQRRSKNVWSFQICKMAIMINCVSSKKALLMNKNLLKYQTVFQWKYHVQILPLLSILYKKFLKSLHILSSRGWHVPFTICATSDGNAKQFFFPSTYFELFFTGVLEKLKHCMIQESFQLINTSNLSNIYSRSLSSYLMIYRSYDHNVLQLQTAEYRRRKHTASTCQEYCIAKEKNGTWTRLGETV